MVATLALKLDKLTLVKSLIFIPRNRPLSPRELRQFVRFDPDEPRDELGQWSGEGGASGPEDKESSGESSNAKVPAFAPIKKLKGEGKLSANHKEAIESYRGAAATVHSFPPSMKMPSLETSDDGNFVAQYDRSNNITFNSTEKNSGLTTAHEMGHMIDNQLVNGGKVGARYFTATPDAKEVLGAIRASKAIQEIKALTGAGTNKGYLTDKQEMFARAYAQWITEKSGDEKMKSDLDKMRSTPSMKNWQWEADDFKPISKAMDKVFTDHKMMK